MGECLTLTFLDTRQWDCKHNKSLAHGWDASPSQGYHPAINSSVLIYTPGWREALFKKVCFTRTQHSTCTPVDLIQDLSIRSTYILTPATPIHCLQCEKLYVVYCTFIEITECCFSENDSGSYLGRPVFQSTPATSGETDLSNFTFFLTRNSKHLMVNRITSWWNVVRQLIEQINNRTPGFLFFLDTKRLISRLSWS